MGKRYDGRITRLGLAFRAFGWDPTRVAAETPWHRTMVRDRLLGGRPKGEDGARERLERVARDAGISIDGDPWEVVPDPMASRVRVRRRPPERVRAWGPSRVPVRKQPKEEEVQEMIPTKIWLEEEEIAHYGLNGDPFGELAPAQAWIAPRGNAVQRALLQAIEHRQIVALIGDCGSGKSTALRRLHHQLESTASKVRWMTPGNLDRGQITEGALSSAMLRDLEVGDLASSSAERRGEFLRKELDRRTHEGEWLVLAIDEAHDLSIDGLIAVKRLWDSFTFNRSLAVILAGQPRLKATLQHRQEVREVTGRTRLVEIAAMDAAAVQSYLTHRLGLVGGRYDAVFAPDAAAALVSRGAVGALWVDALAASAMRHAFNLSKRQVNAAIVARA